MSNIALAKLRSQHEELRSQIRKLIKAGEELKASTEILHADDERVWCAVESWDDAVKEAE